MSRKKIKKKVVYWKGEDVLKNLVTSGILNCDDETREIIMNDSSDLERTPE